jgi:hypothetical protein
MSIPLYANMMPTRRANNVIVSILATSVVGVNFFFDICGYIA